MIRFKCILVFKVEAHQIKPLNPLYYIMAFREHELQNHTDVTETRLSISRSSFSFYPDRLELSQRPNPFKGVERKQIGSKVPTVIA